MCRDRVRPAKRRGRLHMLTRGLCAAQALRASARVALMQSPAARMCVQVQCSACERPTWSGCGLHVDVALAAVPVGDRCTCRPCTQKQMDEFFARLDAAKAAAPGAARDSGRKE